ncbi:MAG: hypothetical protein LWX56_12555, partial [Ignavibacteria bacterium]|nr:hypothetical protein [Ignavibacteria bacterium]
KELKFPVLNATDIAQNGKREMIIQLDTQSTFQTAQSRVFPLDTFYTNVTLSNFANGKYYMRLSLNTQIPSWSKPYIIEKNDMDQQFFLHTQSSFSTQYGNSVDNRTSGVSLAIDTLKYHLWTQHYPGGEILLNGENVLPSSTGDGMSLVVLNPSSLKIDTAIVFNYEADPTALRNMGLYLQTIPDGKIVLMITTGDPTCGTNKFKTDTLTKNAIRRFGSAKVDQIGWFTPWVLIGKVGSAVGTAKEFLRGSDFMGILSLDTTFIVFNKNGYVLTDSVTNVSHWKEAVMTVTTPGNSQVQVIPIIRKDTVTRELAPLTFTGTKASLSALDAQKADSVRFRIQLTASSAGESPAIQNFGLTFDGGMEVGLSPETIKKPASTLILGKTDSIGITVSNAGYQAVDTLNVLTVMSYNYSPSYPVQPNDTLSRKLITNLPAGQRTTFYVPFTIKSGNPSRTIQVKLDPEHRLHEYFTDNNLYSLPVTVYADSTTQADIIFYADSVRIFDGDYISDKAVLRAEIYDPAIRPITDTTFIDTIMVSKGDNDYRIFPGDQKITCTYGTNNPSLSIQYKPGNWEDGHYMYTLRVHNGTKTAQIIKSVAFEVSNSLQMLNVYNYPNPMKDKTNFTFQLSQVPDEMKIKIFTVAGRLIREIVASPAELRAGFNKTLTWDARDKDGDAVANGVYLAKFIVKKDGKTATTVQKLVVMR